MHAKRRPGPPPTARWRARAFTLIEVLAALIIVSLGMLGVIEAVGQTASNSSYLREKTIAHWVAMNRLTEARLQRTVPKIDKTSDEVEMAGRHWHWTMNVTQTPVETIRRIDITVRPEEADKDSSLASVTGFYGTAIAPPGSTQVSWQGTGGTGNPGDDQRNDEPNQEQATPSDESPTSDPGDTVDPPVDDDSLDDAPGSNE